MSESSKVSGPSNAVGPGMYHSASLAGSIAERAGGGGHGVLVGVLQAYIDENGTHDDALLSCGCGYLFERRHADAFEENWAPFLKSKSIPFFHASDCFRDRDDADEIFSHLSSLIVRTARAGVVRFILRDDLASLKANPGVQQFAGSGYSLCVLSCMERMAELATNAGNKIVYFIEDGNEFAGELRHFLNQIKDSDELKKKFAMAGADTYSKEEIIQLQAADLLAWEFGRAYLVPEPQDRRDSFKKLSEIPHYLSGFSDVSASTQGMINSINGLKSNRKFNGS